MPFKSAPSHPGVCCCRIVWQRSKVKWSFSRRVGCLYAPWITEPFWCRRCHHLLYDSQFARRDDTISYANAFMRLAKVGRRLERREKDRPRARWVPERFKPKPLAPIPSS